MGILRWLLVTTSVVVLTTLGVSAFDHLNQSPSSLLGSALVAVRGSECPADMVFVSTSQKDFCIDAYEAAAGDACPHTDPRNKIETSDNLALSVCEPVSESDRVPWRNISRQQAELACVRAGKRLPTNNEWYRAALGTPDKAGSWKSDDCNLQSSGPSETGVRDACVSAAGAHDMIGNVWEWLEETVGNGTYDGMPLPEEGYITTIASNGVPVETNLNEPNDAFFQDYFWVVRDGVRGILRGGYWNSKADGGQYAMNTTVSPSFVGDAVGFRCMKDIAR